jgi:hypothetical protein
MTEPTKLVRVSTRTHATLKWLMHHFECDSRKDVAELLASFATTEDGLKALHAFKSRQDPPGVYVDPRSTSTGVYVDPRHLDAILDGVLD